MEARADNIETSAAAHGEAAHAAALDAADGWGVPQDWNAALDHLRRSAELGFSLAQSSLAGLAGDWAFAKRLTNGEALAADWKVLRDAVDIGAWTRTPRPKILSASPRVALVEQIASPEVCEWVIARARERLVPALVYEPHTGGSARHAFARTNSECHFKSDRHDMIFKFLRRRIAAVTELPVTAMEPPTILHYAPGQHFLPHHDYLDPAGSGYAKDIAERGQRVLTFLLSLNDDYEGGETDFPELGKRFRGHKGTALFFWNVDPDGFVDKRTLHAGLPPTRGEKWMLSQWIRDREYRYSPSSLSPG
jgi:prolyl 4-hydroxylase